MAQLQQKLNHPKYLNPFLMDILFELIAKYSGVFSNGHFSQPMPFMILSYALSRTISDRSSFSLSPSLHSIFTCFHLI